MFESADSVLPGIAQQKVQKTHREMQKYESADESADSSADSF